MYLCVYISTLPPGGSCPPPCICPDMPVDRCIMRLQRNICAVYAAYARQNSRFSADFSQSGNCYGISCHTKYDCKSPTIQICNEVTRLMHLIFSPKVNHKSNVGLHPLSLKVIVIPATTNPKASLCIAISAQVFRNNKLFLQSHGNACAGDRVRQTPNLNYLLTVLRDISP